MPIYHKIHRFLVPSFYAHGTKITNKGAIAIASDSSSYGDHSHTKIAPLPSKITYIKMDPRRSIRNGFANGNAPASGSHSHFYAAWTSRHESSMIPKALKFATLQKKWPPYIPHT